MPVFKICTAGRRNKKKVSASSLHDLKIEGCKMLGISETNCVIVDEADGFEIDDDDVLKELSSHTFVILQSSEDWTPAEVAENISTSGAAAYALGATNVCSRRNVETLTSNLSITGCSGVESEVNSQYLSAHNIQNPESFAMPASERKQLPIDARRADFQSPEMCNKLPAKENPIALRPHTIQMSSQNFVQRENMKQITSRPAVPPKPVGKLNTRPISSGLDFETAMVDKPNTRTFGSGGNSLTKNSSRSLRVSMESVDREETELSDVTFRSDSRSGNRMNNLNENMQLARNSRKPSLDGNDNRRTPYNLEQEKTETGKPDRNNSAPTSMSTLSLKSLVGDVKTVTPQEYNTITKIIQTPELKESSPSGEYFRTILPYIRQRVKMRGCHVLQPGRITALLGIGNKPVFSVSSDPFEQSWTQNQGRKDVSCPFSRLDVITCLLISADDIVKTDLLSSMAQYPMALPLVVRNCDDGTHSIISSHLYGLRVKWETGSDELQRIIEHSLFRDKYRLIVAVRLGNNHTGKSTILNQLFAKEHIFSSVKEPGARYGKPLSVDGSVEMVWLTRETCKDILWNTICKFYTDAHETDICLLANLHGDATEFPETIQLLNHLSCRYLVFLCDDCSSEKWTNFQKCTGKERIAITIRVDPANYQSQNLNHIQTSQLLGEETHEKLRQIINLVLESCVPSTYSDQLYCTKTGKVLFPVKIGTTESQSLIKFVKEKSCKKIKAIMRLQHLGYTTTTLEKKRSILNGNTELLKIIKLISCVLNLSHHDLQLAMVHLEKELARLSDIGTQGARDKSSKKRNELRAAKMKENASAVSQIKEELDSLLQEIGDSYVAAEHLLREISCVHEILQSDPNISSIHWNVAELFIAGQAIELVDGDVSDIPECWLKSIFGVVEKKFPNLRVFVVSVIGLQSSGKSTLLNTLFACRFPVSVGRCTRGLFMRLLFIEKELAETHHFDAILLIDTEGLGSPEKMNDPQAAKKDRQMATFAMSISNLTLINVLGENMVEMAAILQIAIVALTRLQQGKNISPDIMMTQCLTGEKNVQKAAAGQDSFTTAISAALDFIRTKGIHVGTQSSECLSSLKKRVEDGSMLYQLRSYKDGATANAPPSEVYHEDAVKLYEKILECGKRSSKSIFVFNTWHILVTESWKAAGNENFASRFEDIKAVIEYIDREERIAQCKRSIDNVFYVHERQLKTAVEAKVNVVTIEELRRKENEKFLKSIQETLNVIPYVCQEKDKCSESCHQAKLLYESINDERVRAETVKTINDHMTRIRESTMDMLRKKFDAEIVRRGCSVEFDTQINEAAHRYLARHGKETLEEEDSKEIAVKIFQEVKVVAEGMKRPTPITETFVTDLITVYSVYPEMQRTILTATLNFEDAILTNEDTKKPVLQHLAHGFRKLVFGDSSSQELLYLKNRLGALPQEIITRSNAECYDHRIIKELKSEVEKEFKTFQKSNGKLCNNLSEIRLHIWVQKILLQCVKKQHEKWDEKTNPPSVLEASRETYLAMIKTRLVHGFGYKSEGSIMAGQIANTIKLRIREKVDQQIVDSIKNQPWTNSSVLLRVRYFAELALEVKKGKKNRALSHFLKPEESINEWFAKQIDTDAAEMAEKMFKASLKAFSEEAINNLNATNTMEDILRIVMSYYGSYLPPKQVDLTEISGKNFDMLKSALIKTLTRSLPLTTFSLECKPSGNKEIKKCLGCTQQCYWCNALCWFDVDHGKEHSTSHQPRGLRGTRWRGTNQLQAEPCHETKDGCTVYWGTGKFYDDGMPWGQAKAEHFSGWTFIIFKEKKFDDLMRWFFHELHTDIAKQRSTIERPLEPASDKELSQYKFEPFSTVMTALLNDLTSFKDDPFIKELNAEIEKEQMQLISLA